MSEVMAAKGQEWINHAHKVTSTGVYGFPVAVWYGAWGSLFSALGNMDRAFCDAGQAMQKARTEILQYDGEKAWLARPLMLMGDVSFGLVHTIHKPMDSLAAIPQIALTLTGKTGEDIVDLYENGLSFHGSFNLLEDGLAWYGVGKSGLSFYGSARNRLPCAANVGERYVQVTSWAEEGITPDLNPGRWVQLGGSTKLNLLLTGLPGPKLILEGEAPFIRLQRSRVSFENSITDEVPASVLSWPQGVEFWKGFLGQRQLKKQ